MSNLDSELIHLHFELEDEENMSDWELNQEDDDDNVHFHVEFEPEHASTIDEVEEFTVFKNMDRVKIYTYTRRENDVT